jgi:Fe2+ or Zn2+ uptake regulation protein
MPRIIQDTKDKDALTCAIDVAEPSTAETERVAEQRLVAALRERGQRVTSQRLIIHRLLRDLDRHVTAEEVLRRASEQLPGMSLPTVYATLDLLAELGEARRVSVGGPVLYDPRTEDHAHVRCRTCGRVEDLAIPLDARAALDAARAAGYRADTAELVVEGRCAACAATDDV